MDWLLSALSRHLAQRVLLRNRNSSWIEFSEYELVRCLDAVFTGLGYDVFPEWKVDGRRIDLRAQCPTCSETDPEFLIEAKFIWDGEDGRLNAERFHGERAILKDFGPIAAGEATHARHVVVWLVPSRDRDVVTAGEGAKTLRLGDVVALVEEGHGRLIAKPQVLDAGELWKGELQYRFMHLYAWEVRGEPGDFEAMAGESFTGDELRTFLNSRLGFDDRITAGSYQWAALTLHSQGFTTIEGLADFLADVDVDAVSLEAWGTRQGQLTRLNDAVRRKLAALSEDKVLATEDPTSETPAG